MKKGIKYLFKLLFVILLFLFLYTIYKDDILNLIDNNDNSQNNVKSDEEEKEEIRELLPIVDRSESDVDIIKEIFAEGMGKEDFVKVNNQKDNYINSTHDYQILEYNFEDKLHYHELVDYFMKLNYSDIVKLEQIGKSVDNREIYSLEIGKGDKVFFVDANIHAAEIGNTLILLKFMVELVNEYEQNNKEVIEILNNSKLVVIPTINPDGYEVYNFGVESLNNKNLWIYENKETIDFKNIKSNANGVDLNRNMPTQNAGLYYNEHKLISSVSKDKIVSSSIYFGGYSLGSEPETKALMYAMMKHYKNTFAYINMHSQGRVIYAGKPNLSTRFNELCSSFAKSISNMNNYKVYGISSEEVGEGNDGSATDYMAELANGLVFSTSTGRLSTNSYKNSNTMLKYNYPVITLETLIRYTSDPYYFEYEYTNKHYYDIFINILKNN